MRSDSGGPWEPIRFEEPMQGRLALPLSKGVEEFPLNGQLDRVDWCAARQAYRVIDYKYKTGSAPHTLDKNLPLGAVRGLRLQPPLYLLMARASLPARMETAGQGGTPTCDGVWFYYLAPNWRKKASDSSLTRVPFPGDAWDSSLRVAMEQALAVLLDGIRSGSFFIAPGAYCDHCEVRSLCRKTHRASWWRARADRARVGRHRDLRKATLAGDAVGPAQEKARTEPKAQAGRSKEAAKPPRKKRGA